MQEANTPVGSVKQNYFWRVMGWLVSIPRENSFLLFISIHRISCSTASTAPLGKPARTRAAKIKAKLNSHKI